MSNYARSNRNFETILANYVFDMTIVDVACDIELRHQLLMIFEGMFECDEMDILP